MLRRWVDNECTDLHAQCVLEQNRALGQPLSHEAEVEASDDVLRNSVVLLGDVPRLAALGTCY